MRTVSDAGLARFPFKTVPPIGPTDLWLDRKEFRKVLEEVVSTWSYRDESSLYLLWADFGAGKTHALRFVQHLAATVSPPALAVYSDLPKAVSDFKSVYEQIVPQLPEIVLREAVVDFRREHADDWLSVPELQGDRDTPRVLWILAEMADQPQGEVARKWLRGERLSARELLMIDYISPIKTADHATRTLQTICRLVVRGPKYSRLVLLLDEFQRIGEVTEKKIRDVNAGIHTLYNSCPEGLAIFLTYSFGDPANIAFLVTDAVRSRVDRVFDLPPLGTDDATEFVWDLLEQSKLAGSPVRPFSRPAVEWLVQRLAQDAEGNVTPRKVMQVFGRALDKALTSEAEVGFPIDETAAAQLYEKPTADQLGETVV